MAETIPTDRAMTPLHEITATSTGRTLVRVEASVEEELGPVTLDHVADFNHRYPGEVVTFHTRVLVREPLSNLTLRVSLPHGLTLENYQSPPELKDTVPYVEVEGRTHYIFWSLEGTLPAGARYDHQVQARVVPTQRDTNILSQATLSSSDYGILAVETATLAIRAKGRYLRYLPELYDSDELMGRFLMLFESFWAPIETQIGSLHHYLDPKMTPAKFLPWLASWLGLELDERLPEARQRQLIRAAVALHRGRGTKYALQKYLEIYTGGEVKIIEHRAHDFRLGAEAALGPAIALGIGNQPHTFTVTLRLPPVSAPDDDEEERTWRELERRRAIEALIDAEKPAHTDYTLYIETLSPDARTDQADAPETQAAETNLQTDDAER